MEQMQQSACRRGPDRLIRIVLNGLSGPIEVKYGNFM